LAALLEHHLEDVEHTTALLARTIHRRREPRVHEIEAGGAEQVALRRQAHRERGQ
jgi:hypothetical protein